MKQQQPATRTVMAGITMPSIRSINHTPAYETLCTVETHAFIEQNQRTTLVNMLANHKKSHPNFWLAMQIDGRFIRFRRLGSKEAPTKQALADLLNAMGIGEITPITKPKPPAKTAQKAVLPKKSVRPPNHNVIQRRVPTHQEHRA